MKYDARLSNTSNVSNLIHVEWFDRFLVLNQIPIPLLIEESKDDAVWETRTGRSIKYATRIVWKDMCHEGLKVEWRDMIWFPQCIPRHSFVVWMEINSRLFTNNKRVEQPIIQISIETDKLRMMNFKVKDSRVVKEVEKVECAAAKIDSLCI
ncbi:reverse transcriptase zinc-binding domain-containing protein [Tanacetum coccineum]